MVANIQKKTFQTEPASRIEGQLCVPGDKSISHRALMLSAIAEGQSEIDGLLMGADNLATLNALHQLGVNFHRSHENYFLVDGVGLHGLSASKQILDLGNSGTGIRLMTGMLAGQNFNSELTGDESLRSRPMARIVNPLREMGAKIEMTSQNTAPLKIFGGQLLQGIHYASPIASAQVKSCLLLAGLYSKGETQLTEPAPSRDHTERMLKTFNYPLKVENQSVALEGGHKLRGTVIQVPADISSAAFFMVAASIIPGSEILLSNVGVNPTRIGIISILQSMGADIRLIQKRQFGQEPVADIAVRFAKLHGIHIPIEWVPLAIDEFPVILIAAACAQGETVLRGASELRVKETDRIAAMAEGLQKLGISVEVLPDGIIVRGRTGTLQGGEIESYGDHRIAMAFTVAGCAASQSILIHDCANVETSFPGFVDMAGAVGIKVKSK